MFTANSDNNNKSSPSFGEGLITKLRSYLMALPAPTPALIQCPRCNYKLDVILPPESTRPDNLLKVNHFCMCCSTHHSECGEESCQTTVPSLLLQMEPLDEDLLSQIDDLSSSFSSLRSTPESSLRASQRSSYFEP